EFVFSQSNIKTCKNQTHIGN
ncbi:rCG53851, partial [Rattus norvegicus]